MVTICLSFKGFFCFVNLLLATTRISNPEFFRAEDRKYSLTTLFNLFLLTALPNFLEALIPRRELHELLGL
jgi:hypothetical protein